MTDKKEEVKTDTDSTEDKSAETKKTDTTLDDGKQEPILTDEQWEIAFKHPRFKTLNDRASKAEKELEKLNKVKADAEEEKLKEEKKWQELAEKKDSELKGLQQRISLVSKQRAIIEEAIKLGIKDTDAAVKLIDIDTIELDENGQPLNAADVVKSLADAKPYLIAGEPAKNVGANVNPDKQDGQKIVWAQSDLRVKMRDHDWYTKHKEEVDSAFAEGRVDINR